MCVRNDPAKHAADSTEGGGGHASRCEIRQEGKRKSCRPALQGAPACWGPRQPLLGPPRRQTCPTSPWRARTCAPRHDRAPWAGPWTLAWPLLLCARRHSCRLRYTVPASNDVSRRFVCHLEYICQGRVGERQAGRFVVGMITAPWLQGRTVVRHHHMLQTGWSSTVPVPDTLWWLIRTRTLVQCGSRAHQLWCCRLYSGSLAPYSRAGALRTAGCLSLLDARVLLLYLLLPFVQVLNAALHVPDVVADVHLCLHAAHLEQLLWQRYEQAVSQDESRSRRPPGSCPCAQGAALRTPCRQSTCSSMSHSIIRIWTLQFYRCKHCHRSPQGVHRARTLPAMHVPTHGRAPFRGAALQCTASGCSHRWL